MNLKLPIGIQDFETLRTGGFLYVDKTQFLYDLATNSKTYFLSRPRRFGKSLLISTFRYFWEGRRDLFKDLWIEDHWDWTQHYPVLRFSFDAINHKGLGLKQALLDELKRVGEASGVVFSGREEPATRFQELIRVLSQKYGQVVILIDEYDRPIIDHLSLSELPKAHANRAELKNFFSILKSEDANIRFLFLTGVSKFSKVSIFSDLNHLQDLSSASIFNNICGYTSEEIEHYFGTTLDAMPSNSRDLLREWYNGYSWNGRDFVYNPFSILNFFRVKEFHNFWFETGTPTFLVERLNRVFDYALNGIEVETLQIEAFELEKLDNLALLYQTGYLTIKEKTDYGTVFLDYPNREVKEALLRALIADYANEGRVLPRINQIKLAFFRNDMAKIMELLNGLFKSIPNQIFIANREAYFHSITYLTFTLLGVHIQTEVNSSDGRLDALVHTPERLFIFEFKLGETAETALSQIQNQDYAAPYRHLNKPIIGVGVEFSSEKKGIEGWKTTDV
jgi:Predicted AAA-ATPase/PD-(D/E)XK nuclease superfamily